MYNNCAWIIFDNYSFNGFLIFQLHFPWLMNKFCWNFIKFGYPFFYIQTFFIKFFALKNWIEYSKIRCCISTTSRNPLPLSYIISLIKIEQAIPKMFFTFYPINS